MQDMGAKKFLTFAALSALLVLPSCAVVDTPDARSVSIPSPTMASPRQAAVNERPDSVMYLPLGEDILVPEMEDDDPFPAEKVGPFELRGETLAGALQLILADYDVSLAFETQEGLTRRITVANLSGDLGKVVHQVCSLANLYCSYENGSIVVKDTQTFTVTLPPLGSADDNGYLDDVSAGLAAILGENVPAPIVDPTTRTIVYSATQRTAGMATRYFQRLRANTAMIVFETYIWEVSLNSGNSTGIDWFKLAEFGKFNTGISIDGGVGADFTNPISIGLPTTSGTFNGTSGDIIQFLSQFGAVKTISQPQITVLSGGEAELRVADTQNYVSQLATTITDNQATTSVNTDSVDTGFTLTIGSSWDKSTVYANIEIELTDVKQIDDFAFSDQASSDDPDATATQTRIQLPQTSERQVTTQIRVRPGDSVLIAGLVRENDNFNERGPGVMAPILPDSRTAQTQNLELVVLLRPRVIVYTAANDKRYVDYALKKHKLPGTGVDVTSPKELGEPASYENVYTPETKPVVSVNEALVPDGVPAALTPDPMANPVGSVDPRPVVSPLPVPQPAPLPVPVQPQPAPVVPRAPAPAPIPEASAAPLIMPPPAPDASQEMVRQSAGNERDGAAYVPRVSRSDGFSSNGFAPARTAPQDITPQMSDEVAPVVEADVAPAPAAVVEETYDAYSDMD